MVGLRLLQIVLLVFVKSYLYLSTSYHQYVLKVVLHHEQKLLEGSCFQLWEFFLLFSFIALILSWSTNDLQITCIVVSNFLLLCKVGWFSSARAFYNIYVVTIENSCKFFFFSYYFILFSQHNFRIFKKPFVCKKWFN